MKWYYWIVLLLFLAVYGLINYYLGLRGWQHLFKFVPGLKPGIYWAIFWSIVWSFVLGRAGENILPRGADTVFTWIGSFWLGMMFYSLLMIGCVELIMLAGKWGHIFPESGSHPDHLPIPGLIMIVCLMALQLYGWWNARSTQAVQYQLMIPKPAGSVHELHLAMVSDIHLGKIVTEKRLDQLVDLINGINPDLVLFVGDVVDSGVDVLSEEKMDQSFRRLHPRWGAYAVLGNHEYISRRVEQTIYNLEHSGVQVLRDKTVKVADGFYLVGRDDRSGKGFSGIDRKNLADLLTNVDQQLPVIVLDHQPQNLAEVQAAGADLQLSGHTHRGQLFPINLITGLIYENDRGYLRKDQLQVIVSSGFGTWGPPIRLGSRSEVVEIRIRFQPPPRSS